MIIPKKSLSQNFLVDKNICSKIINQTLINNKTILEIGPGLGFLTDKILEKKPKILYLVEKDFNLFKILKEKYKAYDNVKIINEDILNINLNKFDNLLIISNLPYNVSTKIILYLFSFNKNINTMILMIQKEVAYKFDYLLPKMNKYKFLTIIVSTYKRCFNVSSKVFYPKPKVDSTVVKFKFYNKDLDLTKASTFSNLIFKNIRKKISNKINLNEENRNLISKRVDELSIDEILNIYNSF